MHIYTPPGYQNGRDRYPVFYLLHGAGDNDDSWSTVGRAGFVLDNLIADGNAVPMIIVMPNGRAQPNDRAEGNVMASAPAFAVFEQATYRSEMARDFAIRLGLTLPIVLEPHPYPLASDLALRSVPVPWLIGTDGHIRRAMEGFSRAEMETLSAEAGLEGVIDIE